MNAPSKHHKSTVKIGLSYSQNNGWQFMVDGKRTENLFIKDVKQKSAGTFEVTISSIYIGVIEKESNL